MVLARLSPRSVIIVAAFILEVDSVVLLMTGGTAAPAAAAGLSGGSAAAGTAAAGTTAGAAGSAAAGAAGAGAGAGASAGGTATAAAAACGTTTSGFAAAAGPLWGFKAAALSTLGVGMITVGADANGYAVTWDCWKPILHEKSTAPSRGRLLMDLLNDPVVDDFRVESDAVFLRNRWNESWRIDPIVLPWGQVAAHASQIDPINVTSSALNTIGLP
eukprot:TRINITY_DN668_c3_g1_i4.p1 TRINITY_DN668_c3_g1~~TRINITY_DN668_c3_g1_i4.p1  ORF type:complete len:217 (-),score=28.39 TRINITY_DN668_c3_g1_i4:258-908(-)